MKIPVVSATFCLISCCYNNYCVPVVKRHFILAQAQPFGWLHIVFLCYQWKFFRGKVVKCWGAENYKVWGIKQLDNHQRTVLSRFEIKMKTFAVSLNNRVTVDWRRFYHGTSQEKKPMITLSLCLSLWYFFLWQMRLLILLAVLSFFDEHGVAEGLKYTNTWAMQIDTNVTEALKIAGKYGFTFKMEV